ncbi:hypothetical protein [Candidatus Hodarchaeum mangrovi]
MVPLEVIILYLIGIYMIVVGGGVVFVSFTLRILRMFQADKDNMTKNITKGLRGAGIFVGILERAIVLTLSLLNQFGAISFVFLAKSMARFKQLEQRDFAEYYLIGTLTSFFIALLGGVLAQALYQVLIVPFFP